MVCLQRFDCLGVLHVINRYYRRWEELGEKFGLGA